MLQVLSGLPTTGQTHLQLLRSTCIMVLILRIQEAALNRAVETNRAMRLLISAQHCPAMRRALRMIATSKGVSQLSKSRLVVQELQIKLEKEDQRVQQKRVTRRRCLGRIPIWCTF